MSPASVIGEDVEYVGLAFLRNWNHRQRREQQGGEEGERGFQGLGGFPNQAPPPTRKA